MNDNEIIMKIMRRFEEEFIVKDISNKEDSQTTTDRHHEDFLSSQYDREFWIKINRLLEILLRDELNLGNRYETFRDMNDKTKRTLLHYAPELGFLKVAKTLVNKCPLLLSMETKQPRTTKLMFPVALLAEKDEVVAYLIRMMWYERYIEKMVPARRVTLNRAT